MLQPQPYSLHPGLQSHNSEDCSKENCNVKIRCFFHFYCCLLPDKERYYGITLEAPFNVPPRLLGVQLVISSQRDAAHTTTLGQGSLSTPPVANWHSLFISSLKETLEISLKKEGTIRKRNKLSHQHQQMPRSRDRYRYVYIYTYVLIYMYICPLLRGDKLQIFI